MRLFYLEMLKGILDAGNAFMGGYLVVRRKSTISCGRARHFLLFLSKAFLMRRISSVYALGMSAAERRLFL
jgi:hypothetical protein